VESSRFCRSISPAGGGCHSDGALLTGLGAVALLSGLTAWEVLRRRRHAQLSSAKES
jgi:hypothetical protein